LLLHPALAAMAADMQDGVEDVVVTANRIAQETSRVGDSLTVITAQEQRRSQKTAVSDLLAMTPGVAVARTGGLGGTTTIRIRGAESHQTMVLIDGVKLNDPSSASGEFNFADLIATDYAQIEVLRGPQSTLWGSQAIGGVVNIVTPVPEGPLSAAYSVEGGTHETAFVRGHVQAGSDRFAWRVSGNYLTSDGISAYSRDLGGREPDGYRNVGFNARGILHISDNVSAEIRSTWSDGRSEYDGYPPPLYVMLADTPEYGTSEELTTYAGVKFDVFDGRFENRMGFAYTDTDREDTDPSSTVPTTFDADGRNERWEYQGTLRITERLSTIVGLESERSELSTASPTTFDPNPTPLTGEVQIDSAYAQLNVTPIEALSLSAGVRYDDHETFGGHTTTRASAAWSVTPTTILRATYGEGFKAPTLYQLYSLYGNLNLDAEEAEGWDAGIEQHFFDKQLVVSATYFDRDTTNMIDFVSCYGETSPDCLARPDGYYDNFQQTNAQGVELAAAAHLTEQLSLTVNYTNMNAENTARGTANFGHALPRRPDETANAQVSYEWPVGLTTTVAVQHASRSFDTISNTYVLDGYTLFDLRASYAVSDSLEVYGRIENAFDEHYEIVKNYGTLGRTFYAGLRQSF
jgi:vitamin B12 transporter